MTFFNQLLRYFLLKPLKGDLATKFYLKPINMIESRAVVVAQLGERLLPTPVIEPGFKSRHQKFL